MAYAFLAIALKTTLLMCVAGIVSLALSRSSAATRHLVWVTTLTLVLLLPIMRVVMPSFSLVANPWGVPAEAAIATQSVVAWGSWSELFWPGLLAIWGAGALLFLLRDARGLVALMRFSRRAGQLHSPHWMASLQTIEGSCAIRVLETDRVSAPCTWGFFTPVLVLPRAAEHWTESERRYALTHELAHIARRDYISAQVSRLACVVHWYNPLVWYAARQARQLQEQACDDAVLRAGAVASDYAQLLVGVARTCNTSPRTAMGMAERSPLYYRVRAILDPSKVRAGHSRSGALAAILPLGCAMGLIAGARLAEPDAVHGTQPIATSSRQLSAGDDADITANVSNDQPAKIGHVRRARPPAFALSALLPASPQQILATQPIQPTPPIPPVAPIPPIPPTPPISPVSPIPPAPLVPPMPPARPQSE